MEKMGFEVVELSERMAVVGLVEVFKHFKVISTAFKKILGRSTKSKPDVALLIDYPGFNLRLAEKLHQLKIPVIYYVSPQVWAWKKNRVHKIKKFVNALLCVFPFEVDFYKKYSVPSKFVGHPLLDEIQLGKITKEERSSARQKLGVRDDEILLALLPGSRDSEIENNFEIQVQAAEKIQAAEKNVRVLLLVAPTLDLDLLKARLGKKDFIVLKDDPFVTLQYCDLAIVASGTATLVTGIAQVPMVIMYRMNPVTGFLAKLLVRGHITHFGMANLVLGETAVPELFQSEASPQGIAREIVRYIREPEYKNKVIEKLSRIPEKLGHGGVAKRVVDEIVLQSGLI